MNKPRVMSLSRIQVTAVLAATGGLVGAILAAPMSYLSTLVANAVARTGRVEYFYGVSEFAVMGALGTVALGWLMMRRVPLWRAVMAPALGAAVGTLVALAILPWIGFSLLALPFSLVGGAGLAALGARSMYREPPPDSAQLSSGSSAS